MKLRRSQIALFLGLAGVFVLAGVVVASAQQPLPPLPMPGAPIDPNAPPVDPSTPPVPAPAPPPQPTPGVLVPIDAGPVAPSQPPTDTYQWADAGHLLDEDGGTPAVIPPAPTATSDGGAVAVAPPATTGDGGVAPVGDGGAARPAVPEIPLLPPATAPRVEATINPRAVKTGAITKLTIRVTARRDDEVTVSPNLRFEGPLEVRARRSSQQPSGDRVVHTFELDLQPMAPGTINVSPIDLRVVLADGTVGRVQTQALVLEVGSVLGNEPNAQPKPDAPPRSSPQPSWLPGWILGSLLVLASVVMMTLLGARYVGGREKPAPPPPPPRPPWEVALEKLGKIRASSMLAENRVKDHVDGTTDALREYLGGRFGFDGLESTTDEIVARLSGRFGKSQNAMTLLSQIRLLLSDGDLVKFAKVEPTPEHCSSMLDEAVRLVRTTTPISAGGTAGSPTAAPAAWQRDDNAGRAPGPAAESGVAGVAPLPGPLPGESREEGAACPSGAGVAPHPGPLPGESREEGALPQSSLEGAALSRLARAATPVVPVEPRNELPTSPAGGPVTGPLQVPVAREPDPPPRTSFSTLASTQVVPPAPTPVAIDDDDAAIGPDDRRSGDDS